MLLAEKQLHRSNLLDIHEKVVNGERLTFDDGVRLYKTRDLPSVAHLANIIRERKNADYAYYNINQHINYTNICNKFCKFCAFDRIPADPDSYALSPAQIAERVCRFKHMPLTEIHMVAGVNSRLPYSYYLEILRAVKSERPDVHIKAFTMIELDQIQRVARKPIEEVLAELKTAGLGSCPGGGAEILTDRVHKELFHLKLNARQWLDMQRNVHRAGLRSNATMLYGHIETDEERVEHLIRLRELQDETGGFQTFIPLAFHPDNTEMPDLPNTTGYKDLVNIAVARLMLDNFPHIKAFWIMISPRVAQVSLHYGADDVDGTVLEEHITHDAGATTPQGLTEEQLIQLIRETGRIPVQRDTLYNIVKTHETN
ncbi:MAG: aminofutalosine synthase MqnE [bacterium]